MTAGVQAQLMAAIFRRLDEDVVTDLAAVTAGMRAGVIDSSDLDAVLSADAPREALSALASLPSVHGAYVIARQRVRSADVLEQYATRA